MIDAATTAVQRARRAAEVIAPLADRIEAERTLPPEAVAALVEAGVFKLAVPRELGGAEVPLTTLLSVIETIARADGSAGWCAMIGASSGLMAGYLSEAIVREVYAPADAITCGVFAPTGVATRSGAELTLKGRWSFASGCQHSSYRMVGVVQMIDGKPELLPGGAPHPRSVLLRASETRVIDNWNVLGMRGTGSHDLAVEDLTVSEDRIFSLLEAPKRGGALYRLPIFGVLATGVAAAAVGVAEGALERFVGIARAKAPMGSRKTLAHRELIQRDVAQAEAMIRGARAMLHDAAGEAQAAVDARREASLETRAALRLAACHAVREAARAVDLLYQACGAQAIRASEPLQRAFRDVHVATQHAMVGEGVAIQAGRVRLGVDTEGALL